MSQRLLQLEQVGSGKLGVSNLKDRLSNIETNANSSSEDIQKLNETLISMATIPVSTPVFPDIETYTVDGAVKEITTVTVTAGATVTGDVTVTLSGVGHDIAIDTGDTKYEIATKIQTAIDALADWVATVSANIVTITASATGASADATFTDTGVTGATATVFVEQQGKAGSDLTQALEITIPNSKTYHIGKNNLLVYRNGMPQLLTNGDYTETSTSKITYAANKLMDGDVITLLINNPTKLNYTMDTAYYDVGADKGRVHTITFAGDLARIITYTYNASGQIATEVIAENGVTTTLTYTYADGKLINVVSSVA